MKIYETPTIDIRSLLADVVTASDPSVKDMQWDNLDNMEELL